MRAMATLNSTDVFSGLLDARQVVGNIFGKSEGHSCIDLNCIFYFAFQIDALSVLYIVLLSLRYCYYLYIL